MWTLIKSEIKLRSLIDFLSSVRCNEITQIILLKSGVYVKWS
jgi:hypothetical protein